MSMNIYITAEREITFNGEPDMQVVTFDAIQTPTKITNEILKSENPSQTYIDWILNEVSYDENYNIYADDDYFCKREPIGVEIYNFGKEHVEEFKEWIEKHKNKGYAICFSEC